MAYSIQYEPELRKKYRIKKKAKFSARTLALVSVLLIAAVISLFSPVRQALWRFLLPGDPEVTQQALNSFVDDLRAGESVSDAITAFCVEILENE